MKATGPSATKVRNDHHLIEEPPQGVLPSLLKRAYQRTRQHLTDAVAAHDLSASQYGVLHRLLDEPGLSGADLARMMLSTPQAVQQTITALEQRKLVVRTPDPANNRILRARLTARGRKVVTAADAAARAANAELLEGFDAAERAKFIELLRKYVKNSSAST